MKTEMTFDEMVASLEVFDMALVCDNCGRNTWETDALKWEDFHADGCPLKGRRDVHAAFGVNYAYIDEFCDPENHWVVLKKAV